ncbi:hypothetical protein K1719_040893 [Acacia pycnantha]|nr:hypothetical protein K1719_040893 [Acacia pycnantha]
MRRYGGVRKSIFSGEAKAKMEMNKTFFSDVNDTKDTWSILAKVLRKWSVKRKVAPYAVWKVGMLLADEKGSIIEVYATHKNLIGKLKDEPREGMVYNF